MNRQTLGSLSLLAAVAACNPEVPIGAGDVDAGENAGSGLSAGSGGSSGSAGSGGSDAAAGRGGAGATAGSGGAAASGGTGGKGGTGASAGSGGASSCDHKGDCATCTDCATSDGCHDKVLTCQGNTDCSALANCLAACSTTECADQCMAAHPEGANLYMDVSMCIVCDECPVDCNGVGASCGGSGGTGGAAGTAGSAGTAGIGGTGGAGGSGGSSPVCNPVGMFGSVTVIDSDTHGQNIAVGPDAVYWNSYSGVMRYAKGGGAPSVLLEKNTPDGGSLMNRIEAQGNDVYLFSENPIYPTSGTSVWKATVGGAAPTKLASRSQCVAGMNSEYSVAVTPNMFYCGTEGATRSLLRYPTADNAAAPTTVYTFTSDSDWQWSHLGPEIRGDHGHAFFLLIPKNAAADRGPYKIMSIGDSDAQPVELATLEGWPLDMVSDAANLYFTQVAVDNYPQHVFIGSVPLAGGPVTELMSTYASGYLALDATHVYTFSQGTLSGCGSIVRFPKAGGAVEKLADNIAWANAAFNHRLAVDDTAVWIAEGNGVLRVPKP
jgi:hypothetical protein